MQTQQINFRPGDQRGSTSLDWLRSRHSFSFGHWSRVAGSWRMFERND